MASVVVDRVSVSFPIYDGVSRSLRHRIVTVGTGGRIASKSGRVTVEALNEVSFTLSHGDRVGLVGHNGAGKTTLLRVLAGIYPPVVGSVRVEGSIAPIFDIGLGLDPDSTGYENIRLRGLYLGLSRRAIEARVDEIAAFTELGSFLNMPMRTYSAGMQARLAFAVSTSIDPEVLLLDEGVGAGDAAFMERANERLKDLVERSGILVLASHADDMLRRFCNKAILLEHGRLIDFGPVEEVMARYRAPQPV